MTTATTERSLARLPYLRTGTGPPLVMATGLSAEHKNPSGIMRRVLLSAAGRFASNFTVYVTNRRPGLAPGATMSDIAADYARAISDDIGEPVLLHGASTGGSVALQLAIDHPHLVRRLVLASAACRLSPYGRSSQTEFARLIRAGEPRRAAAVLLAADARGPLRYLLGTMGWLSGRQWDVHDPADMLITIAAEDAFDAEPDLHRVQAPTLVLGGSNDQFYSVDLFRRTAAGVSDGRAVIFPGRGHSYPIGSSAATNIAFGFLLAAQDVVRSLV